MTKTEDAEVFGDTAFVYCKSHRRVHAAGWCTVPADNKIGLKSKTLNDAIAEARALTDDARNH